jgi:hypothetical protein
MPARTGWGDGSEHVPQLATQKHWSMPPTARTLQTNPPSGGPNWQETQQIDVIVYPGNPRSAGRQTWSGAGRAVDE